jgi:hypothetical protein
VDETKERVSHRDSAGPAANTSDDEALAAFYTRLYSIWLPTFCNDAVRQYGTEGFKPSSLIRIAAADARDFMRAVDGELFVDRGGGRYHPPRAGPLEQIFWEGLKSKTPRPVSLWHEPIIAGAALARLHFDYGWPRELLGTQSRKLYEFDILAADARSSDGDGGYSRELVVGEVKK